MVTFQTTSPVNPDKTQNIFAGQIAGGKLMAEKRKERMKSKNMQKGYTYLVIAAVALVAYSYSFLYPQAVAYFQTPDKIQQMENEVANYDSVILPNLEKEKGLHKAAYDEEFNKVEGVLNRVFPADPDKLGIVKMLESFATSIHTKTPPFEFNSINFEPPKQEDGYTVLPMSTSIHSSTANFDRFLQLVDRSGILDTEIPVRLMEISNINIRYRGVDERTGEDQGVDFSVKLNAYSR